MQSLAVILLPAIVLGHMTKKPTRAPTAVPTMSPSITLAPTFPPTPDYFDCPRGIPGQEFENPANITSKHGYMDAYLHYRWVDVSDQEDFPIENGLNTGRYCYMVTSGDNAGKQSPVLRAYPGETMLVTLTNDLPKNDKELFRLTANDYCLERIATNSSTNLHFHGFHSQPVCHDDNVIMTIINSGESFTYVVNIPSSQPPGLYWYHPHIHHVADNQVSGGASGVMVIEGIENVQPLVSELPEQIMVFRKGQYMSLNYIPILNTTNPVSLHIKPGEVQFWRIANTMADSEVNLTLIYDGRPQQFRVIAQDGVAVGYNQTELPYYTPYLFLPTGGRVEVIVTGPALGQIAMLQTTHVDFRNTPSDDTLNYGSYEVIKITADANAVTPPKLPATVQAGTTPSPMPTGRVPTDLLKMTPAAEHTLWFWKDPQSLTWFVNVDDEPYQVFDPNAAPAIIGTQGTVEDWTIINNTTENHDFHIHQMHFLVMEVDGVPVDSDEMQYRDMVMLPHMTGASGNLQHSVKIRVDFTGDIVGKFVMHCHILFHEDNGMMRIVEVQAPPTPTPSVNPAAHPLVSPTIPADDDNHRHDYIIVAAVLAALVGTLLIAVVGYFIYTRTRGSSAPPGGHQAVSQAEGAVVELSPSNP